MLQLRQLVGGYVARVDLGRDCVTVSVHLADTGYITVTVLLGRGWRLGYNNKQLTTITVSTHPGITRPSSTDDKLISIPLRFQTKSLKIHIAVDCRHIILHNMKMV